MTTHPLWLAQNLMTQPFVRAQNLVIQPPFAPTYSLIFFLLLTPTHHNLHITKYNKTYSMLLIERKKT